MKDFARRIADTGFRDKRAHALRRPTPLGVQLPLHKMQNAFDAGARLRESRTQDAKAKFWRWHRFDQFVQHRCAGLLIAPPHSFTRRPKYTLHGRSSRRALKERNESMRQRVGRALLTALPAASAAGSVAPNTSYKAPASLSAVRLMPVPTCRRRGPCLSCGYARSSVQSRTDAPRHAAHRRCCLHALGSTAAFCGPCPFLPATPYAL